MGFHVCFYTLRLSVLSEAGVRFMSIILQGWEKLLHQPFFVGLEGCELLGFGGELVFVHVDCFRGSNSTRVEEDSRQ